MSVEQLAMSYYERGSRRVTEGKVLLFVYWVSALLPSSSQQLPVRLHCCVPSESLLLPSVGVSLC